MSIRRFKNRRDENEPIIIAALEAHGFSVARLDTPADLAIARHGATWLAEVKGAKGKPTEAQETFAARWPAPVPVFRCVEDVAAFARRDARVLGFLAADDPAGEHDA